MTCYVEKYGPERMVKSSSRPDYIINEESKVVVGDRRVIDMYGYWRLQHHIDITYFSNIK